MTCDEKKQIDSTLQHALRTATSGNDPDDPGNVKQALVELIVVVGDILDILYNEGP